jgi:hypothetical protein
VRRKRRVSADDALLDDLKNTWKDSIRDKPSYDYLRDQGIRTYSQVYALAKRPDLSPEMHDHLVTVFWRLDHKLNRRKARPALMNLARTGADIPRTMAIFQLSYYGGQQVNDLLLHIAQTRTEPSRCRRDAIRTLVSRRHVHPQVNDLFTRLVRDSSEDILVRSEALECMPDHDDVIDLCITCLRDPSADMRFWAAYRLSQAPYSDLSPAWEALDRVAAHDHVLPVGFGWHIDREALLPLETFYFQEHLPPFDSDYDDGRTPDFRLISPAAEYDTFMKQHRKWQEDWTYTTAESVSPITLRVEPDWLRERIRQRWENAKFNTRQPRPSAYLLDWLIEIDGKLLSGALHRDQYAVVISSAPPRGSEQALFAFAAWYRSVIDATVPLYLYEWADEAVELEPGITPNGIQAAEDAIYVLRNSDLW